MVKVKVYERDCEVCGGFKKEFIYETPIWVKARLCGKCYRAFCRAFDLEMF